MAPSAVASLPESSQRRFEFAVGVAELLVEIDRRRRAQSHFDTAQAGFDNGWSFVGETVFDGGEHLLGAEPQETARDAERDHVGPAFRDGLGQVLHRHLDDTGASFGDHWRRLAAERVTDHQGLRPDPDLRPETMGVQPVDANQEVKLVG